MLISPNSCHDLDVKILTVLAVLLALAMSAFAADCPKDQPKTEAALIELEQNWAANVFTCRDGRWQALAGHETLLGEASR